VQTTALIEPRANFVKSSRGFFAIYLLASIPLHYFYKQKRVYGHTLTTGQFLYKNIFVDDSKRLRDERNRFELFGHTLTTHGPLVSFYIKTFLSMILSVYEMKETVLNYLATH